jgi:RimJ/RimL family protein N-acetyltransferase
MPDIDLDDATIRSPRLEMTAVSVRDAGEMAGVLADPRLHEFTGGRPDSPAELRERYRRWVAGPGEGGTAWLNWIVRTRAGGAAVGTVQATLRTAPDGTRGADIAWVIGVPWQGRGYASEAASALVEWLQARGVRRISASIHPDHSASAAVARRAGLEPTGELHDGEVVWRMPLP